MHFLPGEADNKYHLRGKCIPLQTLKREMIGRCCCKLWMQALKKQYLGQRTALGGNKHSLTVFSCWAELFLPVQCSCSQSTLWFLPCIGYPLLHRAVNLPGRVNMSSDCLFSANFWLTSSIIFFQQCLKCWVLNLVEPDLFFFKGHPLSPKNIPFKGEQFFRNTSASSFPCRQCLRPGWAMYPHHVKAVTGHKKISQT